MDITYSGKDSVKLITKNVTVQINPKKGVKADVVLLHDSQDPAALSDAITFNSPGEYEVKGVMIDAIGLSDSNTAYAIKGEDVKLAYIAGEVLDLNDKQVEAFGAIDILVIALDDQSGESVVKIINQIEPRIVIPIDYTDQALTAFLKEIGSEPEKLDRLKITARDMSDSNQKIILLNNSN